MEMMYANTINICLQIFYVKKKRQNYYALSVKPNLQNLFQNSNLHSESYAPLFVHI
jgi:hypothetical protein